MGTISEKLVYLDETREQIKENLNKFGSNITDNDTFRSYSNVINDIYDKLPKVSANGSDFSLENAQNGKLDLFEMEGNTHQDSYTGKNLANFTNDKNANRSSFNYISETPENITCIKTQTGGKFFARFEANLKANQEYTISWSEKSNYAPWIYIYKNELWGTNDGQIKVSGGKYTPNEDGTYVFGVYADNVPENYELFIKRFQIELSSTATDYEPYVGGSPSPSPDYPQDIRVVENEQNINVHGKNLFNKNTITTSAYLKEDGTLQTGTGAEYITSDFIPIQPNTTYYKTLTLSPRTKFYDANKQVLDNSTYQDTSIGGNAGSFTTPNNAYYFRFSGNVNVLTGIDINTTMVHKGSIATPYEPYQSQDYEIDLQGKNLFDINAVTSVSNGTLGSDGVITSISGTTENFNVAPIFPQQTLYLGKTYYLSADIRRVSGEGSFDKINDYVGDWQMVTAPTLTNEFQRYVYKLTFTVDRNYYRLLFQFRYANNGVFEIKNIMLSESNEDYKPYYNYELCKIGDYQDYLYKTSGKNLFDKNNANILNSSFSADGKMITSSQNAKTLYIPCKPNTTYTISKIASQRFRLLTTEVLPANGVFGIDYGFDDYGTSITITTSANIEYLCVYYFLNGTDTLTEQQILNSIQIEEGSTATSYEPYGKGEWYKKGFITKLIFNGNEDWLLTQTNTNTIRFNCSNGLPNGLNSSLMKIISNKFINGTSTSDNSDNEHIRSGVVDYPSMVSICINKTRLSTQNLSGFKTWLSNNNVTLYYILNSATDTKITDETLISQLEAIETHTGTNIFEVSNENNVLPSLNVKRLKELEKLS